MQPHIGTIISLDMMLVDPCQNGSELPRSSRPLIILLALASIEGTFSLKCTHFHLLPLASLCCVGFKRTMWLSNRYRIEFILCLCIISSLLYVKKFYKWIISEILSHESKGLLRPIFIFLASNVNFLSPHGDNQMKQEDEKILLIKWCICS